MIAALVFISACFVAAYGNAMRKVTWNRRLKQERGEQTAGTSKAYDVTGLVLTWGGLVALGAWCLYIGVGNPVEFVQDNFA